jgi:pimeloyl-ACP methyl ester carboxylesterase
MLNCITRGSGPPIVLLHGLGGALRHWQPMIDRLAPHFEVFALDLIGHGASPKPQAKYTLDFMTDSAIEWWRARGKGPAHLAGLSMGGAIAMRWAERAPDLVSRLTLVAPAGLGVPTDYRLWMAAVPWVGRRLYRENEASTRSFWKHACFDASVLSEEFLQGEIARAADPDDVRVLFSIMKYLPRAGPSLGFNLQWVKVPTLVTWGRQDPIISYHQARIAKALIRQARVVLVDRCGHLLPWEHPDRLLAEMLLLARRDDELGD